MSIGIESKMMKELCESAVIEILNNNGNDPQQLIAILLDIQAASGRNFVDRKWAELVSEKLKLPLSGIFDVLTFYAMFSTEPRGKYLVEICRSAPCHFSGAGSIIKFFEDAAGIKMGETTADGKITLQYSSCFGACDIGPAAKIGIHVFGNLTEEKINLIIKSCLANEVEILAEKEAQQ